MKLSVWAKKQGLHYMTAYRAFKEGRLNGAYQLSTGTIIVPDKVVQEEKQDYVVVYARVSSSMNKSNLESQAERLISFCNAKGWIVKEVIKECGSGLNDSRPKLIKMLSERKATKIVIEHKDRLTRFGFNYIKTLLTDCEIICLNEASEKDEELIQDFTSIITSFCARIYGYRRSKRKTEKLIEELKNDKVNEMHN